MGVNVVRLNFFAILVTKFVGRNLIFVLCNNRSRWSQKYRHANSKGFHCVLGFAFVVVWNGNVLVSLLRRTKINENKNRGTGKWCQLGNDRYHIAKLGLKARKTQVAPLSVFEFVSFLLTIFDSCECNFFGVTMNWSVLCSTYTLLGEVPGR